MKILITNDDGYNAIGIKTLVQKALKYGEVLVCAPKKEQSAKSQAINVRTSFKIKKVKDIVPGVDTYYVDSTPADCARSAYYYLHYDYDIIFSGINNGYNMGEDISYSGTVAAASEAVYINKKAIAFSTEPNDFSEIEKRFDDIMEYIINNKLLDKWNFYNVNVPLNSKKIVLTRQGKTNFDTYFEGKNSNLMQLGSAHHELDGNSENDVYAIYKHNISITPLTVDRTDVKTYNELKNILN